PPRLGPDRQNRQTACWRFVFSRCQPRAASKIPLRQPHHNLLHDLLQSADHLNQPATKEPSSLPAKTESGLQNY
ncbi:hypothetical protein OFC15_32195, partial [Escherichia coli]|nr:hypothetical protein [Escherichia coli]